MFIGGDWNEHGMNQHEKDRPGSETGFEGERRPEIARGKRTCESAEEKNVKVGRVLGHTRNNVEHTVEQARELSPVPARQLLPSSQWQHQTIAICLIIVSNATHNDCSGERM